MIRNVFYGLAALIATAIVVAFALLGTNYQAGAAPRTSLPPQCELVPFQVQNHHGGLSTAWFNWCGQGSNAPAPLKHWVFLLIGDGFYFNASQCPRSNPCTVYGVPAPPAG